MPDATEWVVEEVHSETEPSSWWRPLTFEDAIQSVRQIVAQGGKAVLYQRVPFEVQIGVTVKAPRKRRKTPSPADKPGSDTPTGPGNGAAGELKGAASPQAAEDGRQNSGAAQPVHDQAATAGTEPASPVFPWTCEARFDGDPECPGPVELDPITKGRFCPIHRAIPEGHRFELHRKHQSRNRPVRVAHAG